MLAYVNGEYLPEAEAKISIWDRGFTVGEGVFEGWRTFGGRAVPAIQEKHLARLRRSLRYLEIDPKPVIEQLASVWPQMLERNQQEISAAGDVFVRTIVTGGKGPELLERGAPTITVAAYGIPFHKVFGGDLYTKGARLVPSMMSQSPFIATEPRVKAISRLANARAERKQGRSGSGTWAVSFDNQGFIAEATAAAIAVVESNRLVVPPRWTRLDSVSLQTASDICRKIGVPIDERPLTLFDLLNADEVILFGTTVAVVHVSEIDGIPLHNEPAVAATIQKHWIELVDFNFIEQSRDALKTVELTKASR
jgi:branched-chain amino acid aminotransferase